MKSRRFSACVFLVVIMTFAGCDQAKVAPPLKVSQQTTFITQPITDGSLDYVSLLREDLSKGVTSENNLEAAIRGVVGNFDIDKSTAEKYFAELGIPKPQNDVGIPGLKNWGGGGNKYDAMEDVWTENDFPQLAAWIDKNQASLDAVVQATQRTKYYSPMVWNRELESKPLRSRQPPSYSTNRNLARLLQARGNLHLGRGRCDLAAKDAIAIMRLGRLTSNGTSREFINGTSSELMAIHLLHRILQSDALDVATCDAVVRGIEGLPARPDAVQQIERFRLVVLATVYHNDRHRDQMVESLTKWYDGLSKIDVQRAIRGLDFNEVSKQYNQSLDDWIHFVKNTKLPFLDERMSRESGGRRSKLRHKLKNQFGKSGPRKDLEIIRDWYYDYNTPYVRGFLSLDTEGRASMNLAHTAFGIAKYQLQNGKLPSTLDVLNSRGNSYQRDPYDGSRLKYKVTGERSYSLYSVSENLVDDGGDARSSDVSTELLFFNNARDYVLRIPFGKGGDNGSQHSPNQ